MIKNIFMNLGAVAIALFFIILPSDFVDAAGLVTCDGTDCSLCNLAQMVNVIILWLFGIIFLIFAVIMFSAGWGLVTSGGNQTALNDAKTKFQNALIGLLIVMAAWLLIDTIMKGLVGGGSVVDKDGNPVSGGTISGWGPWADVRCQIQAQPKEKGEEGDAGGTPVEPGVAECNDDAALMAKYHGSPVGQVASGLQSMISCYMSDPTVSSLTDQGQLYTTDKTHPRCSLTNGNSVCGPCSHSNNSMHYGRGSGDGAKAVDFNSKSSETQLYNALKAKQGVCGGTVLFESNHTHISL